MICVETAVCLCRVQTVNLAISFALHHGLLSSIALAAFQIKAPKCPLQVGCSPAMPGLEPDPTSVMSMSLGRVVARVLQASV